MGGSDSPSSAQSSTATVQPQPSSDPQTSSIPVPKTGGVLYDFSARKEPPKPDFALRSSMTSSVDGRQLTHAETLIAKANESRTSSIGAPVSQQGPISIGSQPPPNVNLRESLNSNSGAVLPPVMNRGVGSLPTSWAGWNQTPSLYSSRASARGEDDLRSVRGVEDETRSVLSVRTNEVPLFGPDMASMASRVGADNSLRELYENRYKLLRDDNEMLRENLRREQQAREDIARLMREECSELARRVKEANDAKTAAEARVENELQDVKTLRVTNRELSDACERRAFAMDDLRGRLQELDSKLHEEEAQTQRANAMMHALEASCSEMKEQLDAEKRMRQEMQAEHQLRLKMLSQDHSDKLQQQLSQLNKATQLEADYAQLQESSDILRAKLVTVSDQLSQQMEMKENNDQAHENIVLKEQLAYLQKQLENQNHHIFKLTQEIENQQQHIFNLTQEQESAHEVVSRLTQTNVDLIAQRNALESRLHEHDNFEDDGLLHLQEAVQSKTPFPPEQSWGGRERQQEFDMPPPIPVRNQNFSNQSEPPVIPLQTYQAAPAYQQFPSSQQFPLSPQQTNAPAPQHQQQQQQQQFNIPQPQQQFNMQQPMQPQQQFLAGMQTPPGMQTPGMQTPLRNPQGVAAPMMPQGVPAPMVPHLAQRGVVMMGPGISPMQPGQWGMPQPSPTVRQQPAPHLQQPQQYQPQQQPAPHLQQQQQYPLQQRMMGAHEMTDEEVQRLGYDPRNVIGC